MDSARAHGVPVVVVRDAARATAEYSRKAPRSWNLHKDIAARPADLLVDKTCLELRRDQSREVAAREPIDTLTVSGYMTQMCCDSTAREGFHRGYKVEFLSDATGTLTVGNDSGKVADKDLHNSVLVTQASMFSKVMGTADWIKKLDEK